jgi:hypothetical protein
MFVIKGHMCCSESNNQRFDQNTPSRGTS